MKDFLGVDIEEIEKLPEKHQLTNEAVPVEFDFRCKINQHPSIWLVDFLEVGSF